MKSIRPSVAVAASTTAQPPVPWLFFGLLGLGGLAACAGYAALVLSTATWTEARALDALFPYLNWHLAAFTAAEFQQLHRGLAATALALAAVGLGLGVGTRPGRRELAATGRALVAAGQRLRTQWRVLPRRQRWLAGGLLLGLTIVRTYLSTSQLPWGDDVVSYELFVRQRLLAVSAYYPMPNNHVLANTISWWFYRGHAAFWWAVRLPVLLTSTVGSVLLFAGLLRRAGFGVAVGAAGAFSCLQLSLYYAGAGRGYWLVALLAGLVFFSVVKLLDEKPAPPGEAPAAWLVLLAAGVLGGYTVPTFAYVLASAFSWLGMQAVRRRAWRLLGQAVVVGGLTVGATALLYAPLLLVSGPVALFDNYYVQRWAMGAFWRALPAYAWLTEGSLAGQRSVGAGLTLAGLALFGGLWYRAATGQLPADRARRVRQLGLPALWFMLVPYALLAVQRVQPPERTLLYKAWFFFMLVALVAENVRWQPARRWAAGVGLGLFGLYQVVTAVYLNYQSRRQYADERAVYAWLAQHPAGRPVLVPTYDVWLVLRLQAHLAAPTQPWQADNNRRPGGRYAYVVTRRGDSLPPEAGPVVYTSNALSVRTYRLPVGAAPRVVF